MYDLGDDDDDDEEAALRKEEHNNTIIIIIMMVRTSSMLPVMYVAGLGGREWGWEEFRTEKGEQEQGIP